MKPTSLQAFFDKFRSDFAAAHADHPAIAIDGKEMRRSFDKAAAQSNLNVVTAFAHGARLSPGMTQSAKGGGEIVALRELIEMLDIRGITITADALHCQRETCDLIVQEGGDYCMQLKGNQGDIQADVRAFVADQHIEYIDEYTSVDGNHGRVEERSYRVYDVPDFVESPLQLSGLNWSVPDFSTLSRRQKSLAVSIPYRGSEGPLHLLIDSTGIKVEGEGEWNARKHGGAKRRIWRKVHLGIDEKTLEIRAVEFASSDIGDAPMLPELLGQSPPDQEIGNVTADGAYDTRKCHDAIADRGAHAVIPPRKNAKFWKPESAGVIARNEALRASKRLGRKIWRKWSGYHRRSRAETKMHCMKLLGQRLMAREPDRQVAELQIRVAVMNGFTVLGIPVTEAVG